MQADAVISSECIQMTTNRVRVECSEYNIPRWDWNDSQSKAFAIILEQISDRKDAILLKKLAIVRRLTIDVVHML